VVLADEFDQIVFGETCLQFEDLGILSKLKTLIGFTGSDLKDSHLNALQHVIAGFSFNMRISDVFKPPSVNHGVDVFSRISDYRTVIETTCLQ
jgi:hypothetical protein